MYRNQKNTGKMMMILIIIMVQTLEKIITWKRGKILRKMNKNKKMYLRKN